MTLTTNALSWLSIILKERFGHTFVLQHTDAGVVLSIPNQGEGQIIFPHTYPVFFESRSDIPFTTWGGEAEGWQCVLGEPLPAPGIAALPSPLMEVDSQTQTVKVHYDILGLTYWMLNRIEEIGRTDLDNHGRFPAINSHAFKYGYLERPILDEWLHILGQVIKQVWPSLKLKEHKFSMKVSHDVDRPSRYVFRSWLGLLRAIGGDLIRRRNVKSAVLGPIIKLFGKKAIPQQDPYNTFSWLMDISEKHGLTSAFYFICGGKSSYDADYQIEDQRIRNLIRMIHSRGHEIGLHPSYETYQNPAMLKAQADTLRKACQEEGVKQTCFGGRMHYLRWEHPTTMQAWNDAGMVYDSTLSYADCPGFRCGTCFEYPAFNAKTQKMLKLRIRPLIVMEASVISQNYLALGSTEKAFKKIIDLKDKCSKVSGCFTLLWHNSELLTIQSRKMYEKVFN